MEPNAETETDAKKDGAERAKKLLSVALWLLAAVGLLAAVMLIRAVRGGDNGGDGAAEGAAAQTGAVALDEAETNDLLVSALNRLSDVSAYILEHNVTMWKQERSVLQYEKIAEYEDTWSGYHTQLVQLRDELAGYEPAELFRAPWEELTGFISSAELMSRMLSNWDQDGDGNYTTREIESVNSLAQETATQSVTLILQMRDDYKAALESFRPGTTAEPE